MPGWRLQDRFGPGEAAAKCRDTRANGECLARGFTGIKCPLASPNRVLQLLQKGVWTGARGWEQCQRLNLRPEVGREREPLMLLLTIPPDLSPVESLACSPSSLQSGFGQRSSRSAMVLGSARPLVVDCLSEPIAGQLREGQRENDVELQGRNVASGGDESLATGCGARAGPSQRIRSALALCAGSWALCTESAPTAAVRRA